MEASADFGHGSKSVRGGEAKYYNASGAMLGEVTFEVAMDDKSRANHERKTTQKYENETRRERDEEDNQ
ncbi:uncharacterized protein HKW66_Vig0004680 [Vigna angularis]|uniref:Uncharacterized protein n=1 Tax=Phaseolus angularis TaxID=3914 RepID=A0A8T0LHD4_PHAAN|nr:uncharacterized protein HKW66_Vig0004680 [Vigna angularis]